MNDIGQSILGKSDTALGASPSITGLMPTVCLSILLRAPISFTGRRYLRQQLRRTYKGMSHLTPPKLCVVLEPLSLDLILLLPEELPLKTKSTVVKEGIFLNLASVQLHLLTEVQRKLLDGMLLGLMPLLGMLRPYAPISESVATPPSRRSELIICLRSFRWSAPVAYGSLGCLGAVKPVPCSALTLLASLSQEINGGMAILMNP